MRKIEGKEHDMQKITPLLWFDGKAEDEMNFYDIAQLQRAYDGH
jgi:hypothetical protein